MRLLVGFIGCCASVAISIFLLFIGETERATWWLVLAVLIVVISEVEE